MLQTDHLNESRGGLWSKMDNQCDKWSVCVTDASQGDRIDILQGAEQLTQLP